MKFFSIFFIFILAAQAENIDKNLLLKMYKTGNYKNVCKNGRSFIGKNGNIMLIVVGDACAKADNIFVLGKAVSYLNRTPKQREVASYFATLILEKKLIYQFMNDNISLSHLVLPRTNHVLSRVFENISRGNYMKSNGDFGKKVVIKDKGYNYFLYMSNDAVKKVYIDEYKNKKLIKRHWYR